MLKSLLLFCFTKFYRSPQHHLPQSTLPQLENEGQKQTMDEWQVQHMATINKQQTNQRQVATMAV